MYDVETITQAVEQLTPGEAAVLFRLISDHAELFDKILPGLPLLSHVIGQQTLDHPLAEEYNRWLNAKAAATSAG